MARRRDGFTIVELLIVIVVIAILATVTIVAYNGIQQRARASSASAATSQVASKLRTYAVDNYEDYPSDLASIGVVDSGSTTYQYWVDNSSTPATYCVTATNINVSYYISSSSESSTAGACDGHAVDGGDVATNDVAGPRAMAYAGTFVWRTSRWFGSAPATGTYSLVTGAGDGPVGIDTYARKTWSTVASNGDTGFDLTGSGSTVSPYIPANYYSVSSGEVLAVSCYLRPSIPRNFHIQVYQYYDDGSDFTTVRNNGPTIFGPANTWTRISYIYTVPAGVGRISFACDSNADTTNGAISWTVGATLDGTGAMVTKGSTLYNYADGETPSWIWNGAANLSTSTGPV